MSCGSVESQYLVGSCSPLGHSINNHSSGRLSLRLKSRRAARTRTRAKREDSCSAVPSRHAIVRQARLGKPSASSLTETGDRKSACRERVEGAEGARRLDKERQEDA